MRAILILLLALSCSDWTSVDKVARNITGTVYVFDQNKQPAGQGTGFFVTENLIVTSNHVARFGKLHNFTFQGVNRQIVLVDSTTMMDGLAFFWVVGYENQYKAHFNRPKKAQQVMVRGSAGNILGMDLFGYVAGAFVRKDYRSKVWFLDRGVARGMSGSPIFNKDGHVVGMAYAVFSEGYVSIALFADGVYLLNETEKVLEGSRYESIKRALSQAPLHGLH